MPARLKSFELHGYKTFASKNEFIFSDGITAIVGPNGSGKSNIADALRWVLGEQSYGLLRGKKTEDMIFSGSENRPRAGMASATIVFDNSDGWLPIDFTEVGITRRAYRDGENEYLLNGQRVRLKDVSEVLAKSGLAERTYTIIGQGLVDAALALKAEDRRRLFEEAAGIGLHRTRREEALKRLETTRRNLERVQDILAELQPRLRSLERQAKRVQEYNQMKADLRLVLREWYGYHWHLAQSELVEAQIDAKQKEDILTKVQSTQLNLDQKLSAYRSQINEFRGKLADWHKELTALHQRREALSREQAVNNERSRLLIQQLEQLDSEKLKLGEDAALQKDQLELSNLELEQLEQELTEARQSAADSIEAFKTRQLERLSLEERIHSLQKEISSISARMTQLQARQAEKDAHISRLKSALNNIEKEIMTLQDELSSAQKQLNSMQKLKDEKAKESQISQSELSAVKEKITALEQERKELSEKMSGQLTVIAKVQAEINVLEDAENNLTGYEEGARILLQAVKEHRLEGAIGALGSRLTVPEEYESAIAALLGEYIDSLVIESLDQTDQALDLIESEAIRGSIFPLDAIAQTRSLSIELDKAPVDAGKILGIAADLIKTEPRMKPISDLLFGQAIVVKDRKTARVMLASSDWRKIPNLRIVTISGEIYLSSGPIIRGASRKGLLVRPRQRRESKVLLEKARSLQTDYESKLSKIERNIGDEQTTEEECKIKYQIAEEAEGLVSHQLHQIELQAEKIQRNLQFQHEQKTRNQSEIETELIALENLRAEILNLREESKEFDGDLNRKTADLASIPLEELAAQNAYWNTNCAVIEQALQGARKRQQDKADRLGQLENNLSDLTQRSTQLEVDINSLNENMHLSSAEETQIAGKIELLSDTVTPMEEQLSNLETEHNSLLSTDTEARQALRSAEQQYTQAKIAFAHHQESFETLRGHIEDDFGLVAFDYTDSVSGPTPLPLDGMVEQLPKVDVLSPELEETIRQQKAQIRRMGAINPEAQAEYQEVKARYEFLTSQVQDMMKAEGDIREIIAELDMLMEREFQRTFEAVAQEFKQIFTRLFGGGSARLALTDPENMTETGIDIEARLPGRREQGLSLLSGGERSLTAAALVFALLRVSPTPFCILDEVDAMLDEANVGRFRDLLTELSEKTQFIVITHNRNTVQAASIIYGVTMGRDSASQVISLRMDELGEEFGV
jgi:chromosome segregation protein